MFEKSLITRALSGATKALESRNKILKVLKREEDGLDTLIHARVEAERAVVAAETAEALDERSDVASARQRLAGVVDSLGKQSARLGGLRLRLAQQVPDLQAQRASLKEALPGYIESVTSAFASEWELGARAFAALRAKRERLQALIGERLELPEPEPVSTSDGPEADAPWTAIKDLEAALDEIANWSRAADWPVVDAMLPGAHPPYDPTAVYVVTSPQCGREPGTYVMDSSFVPGTLAHFIQIGYAAPLVSQDWRESLASGSIAAGNIASEAWEVRERQANEHEEARFKEGQAQDTDHLRTHPTADPYHRPAQSNHDRKRAAALPSASVNPSS